MSDIQEAAREEIFCYSCGTKISTSAAFCPNCGAKQNMAAGQMVAAAHNITVALDLDYITLLLLALFLGGLGAHRFYARKIGTGILMLLTGGGLGIWWLIDFIIVFCGKFTDKNGDVISGKRNDGGRGGVRQGATGTASIASANKSPAARMLVVSGLIVFILEFGIEVILYSNLWSSPNRVFLLWAIDPIQLSIITVVSAIFGPIAGLIFCLLKIIGRVAGLSLFYPGLAIRQLFSRENLHYLSYGLSLGLLWKYFKFKEQALNIQKIGIFLAAQIVANVLLNHLLRNYLIFKDTTIIMPYLIRNTLLSAIFSVAALYIYSRLLHKKEGVAVNIGTNQAN
jgi:TM2 domain-containing membrane protein YozV